MCLERGAKTEQKEQKLYEIVEIRKHYETTCAQASVRTFTEIEAARPSDDGRPDEPTVVVGCHLAWRRPLLAVPGGDRFRRRDVLHAVEAGSELRTEPWWSESSRNISEIHGPWGTVAECHYPHSLT